jgi:hypothetical protein
MNPTNRAKVEELIELLHIAKLFGFDAQFSPIEPLLEAGIDICLLLSRSYKEGTKQQKTNPKIISTGRVDSLGNPKLIKVYQDRQWIWDPRLGEFFTKMAQVFALLRKGGLTFSAFMAKIEKFFRSLQPPIKTSEKRRTSPRRVRNRLLKQRRRDAYYRRKKRARSDQQSP